MLAGTCCEIIEAKIISMHDYRMQWGALWIQSHTWDMLGDVHSKNHIMYRYAYLRRKHNGSQENKIFDHK